MISDKRLDELLAIALGATPGPWSIRYDMDAGGDPVVYAKAWDWCGKDHDIAAPISTDPEHDAAHIAAFHPETALELIAEVRRLRLERDSARETAARFMEEAVHKGDKLLAIAAAVNDDRIGADQKVDRIAAILWEPF